MKTKQRKKKGPSLKRKKAVLQRTADSEKPKDTVRPAVQPRKQHQTRREGSLQGRTLMAFWFIDCNLYAYFPISIFIWSMYTHFKQENPITYSISYRYFRVMKSEAKTKLKNGFLPSKCLWNPFYVTTSDLTISICELAARQLEKPGGWRRLSAGTGVSREVALLGEGKGPTLPMPGVEVALHPTQGALCWSLAWPVSPTLFFILDNQFCLQNSSRVVFTKYLINWAFWWNVSESHYRLDFIAATFPRYTHSGLWMTLKYGFFSGYKWSPRFLQTLLWFHLLCFIAANNLSFQKGVCFL